MATLVAGKLDEISLAIGELKADTKGLRTSFDKHCVDDDRRHGENLTAINALTEAIQASRWKRIGAAGVIVALFSFIGWLMQPFIVSLVHGLWK